MKNNPEKTAWRLSNMSYPEKVFMDFLIKHKLNKKYLIIREYSFFPYFIDFAFVDLKVAIEIDGSQHLTSERKKKDDKKDNFLKENGWRILRISENEVKTNFDNLLPKLECFINSDITFEKVGLTKLIKNKKSCKTKNELKEQKSLKQRKVERPTKDELLVLIQNNSFVKVGKIFSVSDNTIRKWCRYYGLPYIKKDIMQM